MRRRFGWLPIIIVLAAACQTTSEPPVPTASPIKASARPSVDELAALRAGDQFDEFAQHQRAAKADGARLAWQNFAPIVDGKRVEWANKAELWDAIAPKIRDEALLLGPEYREPLWNNRNAIPNSVDLQWTNDQTSGRGHYFEFVATHESSSGPTERVWGFLVGNVGAEGSVLASMPPVDLAEADYEDVSAAREWLAEKTWAWIQDQKAAL